MLHRDIEREDKIEQGMWLANEGMWLNKIDIQVLLSLLIDKGIINREEVVARREFVGSSKKYKIVLDEISQRQEELQARIDFGDKIKKTLNKTATKEEKQEIIDWLSSFKDKKV